MNSHSNSRTTLSTPIILAFCSGFVSASSLVFFSYLRNRQHALSSDDDTRNGVRDRHHVDFNSGTNMNRIENHDADDNIQVPDGNTASSATSSNNSSSSLIRRWMSIDDLKSRIGELPSLRRRTRWPWDRMKRSNSKNGTPNETVEEHRKEASTSSEAALEQKLHVGQMIPLIDDSFGPMSLMTSATASGEDGDEGINAPIAKNDANSSMDKSGLCIGNIFGIDVGGTLAKLAYFEQKEESTIADDYVSSPSTASSKFPHNRERLYRRRASARAVIMARRAVAGDGWGRMIGKQPSHRYTQSNNAFEPPSMPSTPTSLPLRRERSHSLTDSPSKGRVSPSYTPPNNGLSDNSAQQNCAMHRHRQKDSLISSSTPLKGHIIRKSHSSSSDDDLENLKLLRQESLPDDLRGYFRAVDGSIDVPKLSHRNSHSYNNINQSFEQHCLYDAEGYRNNDNDDSLVDQDDNNGSENDFDERRSTCSSTENTNDCPTPMIPTPTSVRRSRSMFDLHKSRDHAEALDRFYSFARRLDSYRDGVKDDKLSFYCRQMGGEFHFIRFETRRMQNAMDLIRANGLHVNIREMGGTGGGAHRFADQWEKDLGIQMKKQDELDSLVAGMQFVLGTVVGECYTFRPRRITATGCEEGMASKSSTSINGTTDDEDASVTPTLSSASSSGVVDDDGGDDNNEEPNIDEVASQNNSDMWTWNRKVQRDAISCSSTYPYLVVTIGTGVSILRVDGPRKYERVSGSTIGGGTYLGLIRLLTDVDDFDEIMRLAEKGDPTKCDMMVGDIYGDNVEALKKLGLPSNIVASSFGKLVSKEDPAAGLKQEDLARALLLMITINIGQVSYLNAQLMNTSRIYFVGNFLRENKLSQRRLSYAINYWSKGKMEALFLEHEGYFGALGAFLLTQEEISSSKKVGINGSATKSKQKQSRSTATRNDY